MSDIKKEYTLEQEQIARFAKALGHPARIAILHFLAEQTTCYFGDIHEELPIAKATVSQHLKELKEAGLIQGEIETPKVKYCINRANWELAQRLFGRLFQQCAEKNSLAASRDFFKRLIVRSLANNDWRNRWRLITLNRPMIGINQKGCIDQKI